MTMSQRELKRLLEYDPNTGMFKYTQYAHMTSNSRKYDWFIGTPNHKGYMYIRINYKLHAAHRLAWLYIYGRIPKEIDHINRNTSDNRISNLRELSRSENHLNRNILINNTSGKTGVHYNSPNASWRTSIIKHGVQYRKGFKTKEEAIEWREKMEMELYREPAPSS